MVSKSKKPQLTTDSSCLTLPVNQIVLVEEHLKSLLASAYESGVKDTQSFHWKDFGVILLSISGTLFLACLTSTFNDFSDSVGFATQAMLTATAWIIIAISFIGGLIAIGFSSCKHNGDVFCKREKAVEGIVSGVKS